MMNYFLRAFSNTHFARSYLTDSRCASPIRIVSRIKSCLENSSLSETCASSLSNSSDNRKLIMMGSLFLSFMVKKYLKTLHLNQIEKSSTDTTFILDSSIGTTNMKLMIVQNIRISEDLEAELTKLAKEIGESKQTAIRLALREGIEVVRRKFSPQPIPQKATKHSNL